MKKVLCHFVHKEEWEKALQKKYEELRNGLGREPIIEGDRVLGYREGVRVALDPYDSLSVSQLSQDAIRKKLWELVPKENYTEEKQYLLIDTALENGKVMLIVCDFNGENIEAISAENCKIIEE